MTRKIAILTWLNESENQITDSFQTFFFHFVSKYSWILFLSSSITAVCCSGNECKVLNLISKRIRMVFFSSDLKIKRNHYRSTIDIKKRLNLIKN